MIWMIGGWIKAQLRYCAFFWKLEQNYLSKYFLTGKMPLEKSFVYNTRQIKGLRRIEIVLKSA